MANLNFSHLLRDNKRTSYPERFIFFDTETEPIKISDTEVEQRLRLGMACYLRFRFKEGIKEEKWLKFKSPSEFWDFVYQRAYKKSRLVLIAHNVQFDFKVVEGFKELKRRGFEPTKIILNNTCNIWRFASPDRSILVLDNLNYFRVPLKVLGQNIGLSKMKMPAHTATEADWFRYCKRDVEILKRTWIEWINFVRKNNLGCFGLTLPSQSFNAYRHRFKDFPIYIHKRKKVTALERESYHGGRTECFYLGDWSDEKFYSLDVNSMYPYVMRKFKYPLKLKLSYQSSSVPQLSYFLKRFSVIAKVKLDTPEPIFPYKLNERLVFPTGVFETALTTQELKMALSKGYIKKVYQIAVYEQDFIFKSFVDYFYGLRKKYKAEGNYLYDYLSKLLMNSLYGKFGQRNEVFETVGYDPSKDDEVDYIWDLETNTKVVRRIIMGKIEISREKVEGFNSFPAISAQVTANARLHLWKLIKKAGRENVFYCDTDSLFVNEEGYHNLLPFISQTKIGYLKLERQGSQLEIRGLKDYTFGELEKIKGIKKDAVRLDKRVYWQWHFESVKGALRKGNLNRQRMYKIIKTLKRNYKKGQVLSTGEVIPFNLPLLCPEDLFSQECFK